MKNFIILFLSITFLLTTKSFSNLEKSLQSFVKLSLPSHTYKKNNPFCGAVKIGPLSYLSASHCTNDLLPGIGKIKIYGKLMIDENLSTVNLLSFPERTLELGKQITHCNDSNKCFVTPHSKWKDLVLFHVEEKNNIPIVNATKNIIKSDTFIISHIGPRVGPFILKNHAKAKLKKIEENTARLQLTSFPQDQIKYGDSGSPVWVINKDQPPSLVGIVSSFDESGSVQITLLDEFLLNTNIANPQP